MIDRLKKHKFLFEELVKRDFTKKYKRTVIGMGWSVLSPLSTLLIMRLVFTNFFGIDIQYYTTFLFSGNIVFSFFTESTTSGMTALADNASIFTKVNIPKYLFLFSKTISSLINFALILIVYFLFVYFDGIPVSPMFIFLLYPIICLVIFNLGLGLILSALYMFFKDMTYLWNIFTFGMSYLSGIFYNIDTFSKTAQMVFYLNPLYIYISCFRVIVIEQKFLTLELSFLAILYALLSFFIGAFMYKKYNHRFLFYI
jgi:hypothetical protein